MVLCPSIPLQKLFLLQAVHMILKCPLNNFFWMTPYFPNFTSPIASIRGHANASNTHKSVNRRTSRTKCAHEHVGPCARNCTCLCKTTTIKSRISWLGMRTVLGLMRWCPSGGGSVSNRIPRGLLKGGFSNSLQLIAHSLSMKPNTSPRDNNIVRRSVTNSVGPSWPKKWILLYDFPFFSSTLFAVLFVTSYHTFFPMLAKSECGWELRGKQWSSVSLWHWQFDMNNYTYSTLQRTLIVHQATVKNVVIGSSVASKVRFVHQPKPFGFCQ